MWSVFTGCKKFTGTGSTDISTGIITGKGEYYYALVHPTRYEH